MSVNVTYICDKCGAEQKTFTQFWDIGFTFKEHRHGQSMDVTFAPKSQKISVCRKCLEEMGLVPKTVEPKLPTVQAITVEDLVREIVSIELDQRGDV